MFFIMCDDDAKLGVFGGGRGGGRCGRWDGGGVVVVWCVCEGE